MNDSKFVLEFVPKFAFLVIASLVHNNYCCPCICCNLHANIVTNLIPSNGSYLFQFPLNFSVGMLICLFEFGNPIRYSLLLLFSPSFNFCRRLKKERWNCNILHFSWAVSFYQLVIPVSCVTSSTVSWNQHWPCMRIMWFVSRCA